MASLPKSKILSQELKFRDQVITRTEITWQWDRYDATTIFIIGILFISFHQAKKELNPPEQEISGGRESLLKWASHFQNTPYL